MCSVHAVAYSALNRKEILTPATTQVDLEQTMLNEVSRTQKDRSVQFHSHWVPEASESYRQKAR